MSGYPAILKLSQTDAKFLNLHNVQAHVSKKVGLSLAALCTMNL